MNPKSPDDRCPQRLELDNVVDIKAKLDTNAYPRRWMMS